MASLRRPPFLGQHSLPHSLLFLPPVLQIHYSPSHFPFSLYITLPIQQLWVLSFYAFLFHGMQQPCVFSDYKHCTHNAHFTFTYCNVHSLFVTSHLYSVVACLFANFISVCLGIYNQQNTWNIWISHISRNFLVVLQAEPRMGWRNTSPPSVCLRHAPPWDFLILWQIPAPAWEDGRSSLELGTNSVHMMFSMLPGTTTCFSAFGFRFSVFQHYKLPNNWWTDSWEYKWISNKCFIDRKLANMLGSTLELTYI